MQSYYCCMLQDKPESLKENTSYYFPARRVLFITPTDHGCGAPSTR